MSNNLEVEEIDQAGDDEVTSLEEGKILDYITGDPIKDSAKEQVRQRIARALFHEYGISVEDMARDFKMKIDGRKKKGADIAIFAPGEAHTVENLTGDDSSIAAGVKARPRGRSTSLVLSRERTRTPMGSIDRVRGHAEA